MTYPAFPGRKIPYDIIGGLYEHTTYSLPTNTSRLGPKPASQATELNDEDGTSAFAIFENYVSLGFSVWWPTAIDVSGIYLAAGGTATWNIYTSVDTNDGVDGTWVDEGAYPLQYGIGGSGPWRGVINPVSYLGVKGIKITAAYGGSATARYVYAFHVYGNYDAPTLSTWNPTLDEGTGTGYFDYGDVWRGDTMYKQFRVKNNSALAATGVVVSNDIPYDPSTPTIASQMTYSYSGSGYGASVNIGDLAPGAISGVITQRFMPPVATTPGTFAGRINMAATSWA